MAMRRDMAMRLVPERRSDAADAGKLRADDRATRRPQWHDQAAGRDELSRPEAAQAHQPLIQARQERRPRIVLWVSADRVVGEIGVDTHAAAPPREVEPAEVARRFAEHVAGVAEIVGEEREERG